MSDTFSNQNIAMLLAALPIPVLLVGGDGRVAATNAMGQALLGSGAALTH